MNSNLILTLFKLFLKTENKRTLPKSFYETLRAKFDKYKTKKIEYIRTNSRLHIDENIFNETFANQFQEHIKRVIYHSILMSFLPQMPG